MYACETREKLEEAMEIGGISEKSHEENKVKKIMYE